jgi:hypothetical protein
MSVQVGEFVLDDNPYPGIPKPFRSNTGWLQRSGILPDPTYIISNQMFFVGQRVRHRAEEFGRSSIKPTGMEVIYLAGHAGTVRGFVEYREKVMLLVHWDGTPIMERQERLCLGFYWCSAERVDIIA